MDIENTYYFHQLLYGYHGWTLAQVAIAPEHWASMRKRKKQSFVFSSDGGV
jgi:hypothetical protein